MSELIVIALGVQAYALCYLTASLSVSANLHQTVKPWHVGQVVREAIGCFARRIKSKPALSVDISMHSLFKMMRLDEASASEQEVLEGLQAISKVLDRNPWCYPASQRKVLVQLGVQAVLLVRKMAVLKALHQAAQGASSRRKATPSTPSRFDWRQVLGLPGQERDPKVIRKAFGRLVSKDHPDRGGTGQNMHRYTQALDAARAELGFV